MCQLWNESKLWQPVTEAELACVHALRAKLISILLTLEEFDARTLLFLPTLIPAASSRTSKVDNKPPLVRAR